MSPIVMLALACAAAYFVGRFLFNKTEDSIIESRAADAKALEKRRIAARIAVEMREAGLQHLPELFVDYAAGDEAAVQARLQAWYELMRVPSQRQHYFSEFLAKQLDLALRDEERCPKVIRAVEEWQAAQRARADRLYAEETARRQAA